MKTAYFNSTAGKVYYEETGQGEPLLFIHGRTLDLRMWKPQIDYFKDKFRCITYDLNGFGKSEVPSDGYSRVQTLKELIEHLGLKRVNIVALSLGTHVALSYALQYQESVKSMVLMSCTVPGVEFSQEFLDDWAEVENAGKSGDFDKAKSLWIDCKAFSQLKLNNQVNYKLFKQMITDYTCWDIYNPPNHFALYKDVRDRLNEIKAPTLTISGGKDYEDFKNNAKLLAKKLSDIKCETIASSGHMVNLEFPDIVNSLVDSFLSTV